jgi:hypothetical protein
VLPHVQSCQTDFGVPLQQLLCGGHSEDWRAETIERSLVCKHGFSRSSPQIAWLVRTMAAFDRDQRKQFLMFITGTPRCVCVGVCGRHALPLLDLAPRIPSFTSCIVPCVCLCVCGAATVRLPIGGFPALRPNLTVVRKDVPGGFAVDDYLPSCSTCQVSSDLVHRRGCVVLQLWMMTMWINAPAAQPGVPEAPRLHVRGGHAGQAAAGRDAR